MKWVEISVVVFAVTAAATAPVPPEQRVNASISGLFDYYYISVVSGAGICPNMYPLTNKIRS